MKLDTDAIEALSWLDDKQDSMLNLIVDLCDINSGTYNLDGLEKVRNRLIDEFSALGGKLDVVDSNLWMTVDDRGESDEGKSVTIGFDGIAGLPQLLETTRPQFSRGVWIGIHRT